MKMPTTRYGRFLFYRDRAKRRRERIRARRRKYGPETRKSRNRELDTSAVGWQLPKTMKKGARGGAVPNFDCEFIYIEPDGRKRPPVWKIIGTPYWLLIVEKEHPDSGLPIRRRAKKWPKLRALPAAPFEREPVDRKWWPVPDPDA